MVCDEEILFIDFKFGDDFKCEFDIFEKEFLFIVIVVFCFEVDLVGKLNVIFFGVLVCFWVCMFLLF